MKINKTNILHKIYLILVIFSLILKAYFQLPDHDETFILTLSQRILNGEKLFINEWNASQLTGIINIPIFAMYNLFFKDYRYIVLFERITSLVLWILLGLYIYKFTKKNTTPYISMIIFTYFLLIFSSTMINSQYNLYSVGGVIFSLITIAFDKKKSYLFLSGFIFSVSVLAHPLNIVLYLIFFIFAKTKFNNFTVKDFIKFSFFPIINFIILMTYLIINDISFIKILNNLDFILEHANIHTNFIQIIGSHYKLFIMAPLLIISAFDKCKIKHKYFYILIQSILLILLDFIIIKNSINNKYWYYYNIPFMVYLTQFYILTNKKEKKFIVFFLVGIIYSYILNIMSDTKIFIISLGLSVCNIFGIIFLHKFLEEETNSKLKLFVKFIIFLQITTMLIIGIIKINLENSIYNKIVSGPYSGLYLSEKEKELYFDDISTFIDYTSHIDKNENILVMIDPKLYLINKSSKINSFSSFMYFNTNYELVKKLNTYYAQPDIKKPEFIYFIKNTRLDENELIDEKYIIDNLAIIKKYHIIENSSTILLIKLIKN